MIRFSWFFAVALAVYGVLHAIPARWLWLDVAYVSVVSGSQQPLKVDFLRTAHRNFLGSYSVVIRDADQTAICDAVGGPFTYKRSPATVRHVDMEWWAPSDNRCSELPVNVPLTMETCWTVHQLFWGWVPPKRLCIKSDEFRVTE